MSTFDDSQLVTLLAIGSLHSKVETTMKKDGHTTATNCIDKIVK